MSTPWKTRITKAWAVLMDRQPANSVGPHIHFELSKPEDALAVEIAYRKLRGTGINYV